MLLVKRVTRDRRKRRVVKKNMLYNIIIIIIIILSSSLFKLIFSFLRQIHPAGRPNR